MEGYRYAAPKYASLGTFIVLSYRPLKNQQSTGKATKIEHTFF
jgi:hypothetical protein